MVHHGVNRRVGAAVVRHGVNRRGIGAAMVHEVSRRAGAAMVHHGVNRRVGHWGGASRRLISGGSIPTTTSAQVEKGGLLLRGMMVTTTVALATPLMTMGGVVRVFYMTPKSTRILTILAGGGITTVMALWVLPFHLNNSEWILPFALSNAITAGGFYTCLELAFSFPAVLKLPWLGAGLGCVTATTAPLIWPYIFPLCFAEDFLDAAFPPNEGQNNVNHRLRWLRTVYYELLIPVAMPISILAGTALQAVLVPLSTGGVTQPQGWFVCGALGAVFVSYHLLCRGNTDDYWFERRMDKNGVARSVNLKTQLILDDGGTKGDEAVVKREVFDWLLAVQQHFDFFHDFFRQKGLSEAYQTPGGEALILRGEVMHRLKNDGGVKTTEPTTADVLTLSVAKSRSVLYPLIDALVRYKHIQLGSGAEKDKLHLLGANLRNTYQIDNVEGFIVDCEDVLIGGKSSDAAARRIAAHSHPATALLSKNLLLLQEELQAELGYLVGQESSKQAVRDRRWSIVLSRTVYAVAAVGTVLLSVTLFQQ